MIGCTVIVPLSRHGRALRLLEMFAQQAYSGPLRILFVENGDGIGLVDPGNAPFLHVIRSERSVSAARNAGLEWVRRNGGGAWAMWDDDDWYGPDYLQTAVTSMIRSGCRLSGKAPHFVLFPSGLYRMIGEEYTVTQKAVTGGTLCGMTADGMPKFEGEIGEDVAFCSSARNLGYDVWVTGRYGYCYDRSKDEPRAWSAGEATARRGLSFGREMEYYGLLPPEAAGDRELRPKRIVPPVSPPEMFAEMAL